MSNSAHSEHWEGASGRGQRLARKLGDRLSLARLEELLRFATQPSDDEPKVPQARRVTGR